MIAWDEPKRVVLTWQINGHWAYDPEFETTIDVAFEPRDGTTLVTFEHRDLDVLGRYQAAGEKA